jgi:DNA repair exonuclease SbcCD ATPase subunit
MTDEELKQALAELGDVVRCRCHEAYKGRGLHDPDCQCDSAEALATVTKHIEALSEQLEAARADAKEAEAYAEELEKERDEWKSLAEAAIKDDASKNIYYAELKAKLANCEKYRDAYAECDRIGTQAVRDLEAKLAKAVEALKWYDDPSSQGDVARTTLAEIEGENG